MPGHRKRKNHGWDHRKRSGETHVRKDSLPKKQKSERVQSLHESLSQLLPTDAEYQVLSKEYHGFCNKPTLLTRDSKLPYRVVDEVDLYRGAQACSPNTDKRALKEWYDSTHGRYFKCKFARVNEEKRNYIPTWYYFSPIA